MKKLAAFFVLSLFFAVSAMAAPYRGGKLTIYSHHESAVRVYIDGKRYSLEYNMLVVNDVVPGNHTIKIVERQSTGSTLPANQEKVLYNGSVYFRSDYHVDIVINRFGKTLVDEQDARNSRWDGDEDYYEPGLEAAMTDAAFESLKRTLQQERFTASRMTVAKTAISNNYFKTAQVRQLAQLFSFEDDKMQVVKLAYAKTVDRSNYYQLSDLFSFSSNKEALSRFIQENSNQYNNGSTERTVISDNEFSRLKSKIQSTFSESSRLTAARQAIDGNYFTAGQVKDLVVLFSNDSTKLEMAKYAYGKTINQADYLLYLSNVFALRTSKDELERYVANYN